METIKELQNWMKKECYNDFTFFFGDKQPFGYEGEGLIINEQNFNYIFTERGKINVLESFKTESEACQFVFEKIKNNKTAKAHVVGYFKSEKAKDLLCEALLKKKIEFEFDKIPYGGIHDPRYRVFVFGCDVNQAKTLPEAYIEK